MQRVLETTFGEYILNVMKDFTVIEAILTANPKFQAKDNITPWDVCIKRGKPSATTLPWNVDESKRRLPKFSDTCQTSSTGKPQSGSTLNKGSSDSSTPKPPDSKGNKFKLVILIIVIILAMIASIAISWYLM